jgi:histidyl-tRNA synthetase
MRALNYYTSTVFEVFDTSPENRRSIFGGGRYDDLASLFTTKRIPGVGFGMGDVTTWNFLEGHGLLPAPDLSPDIYVFGTKPEYRSAVSRITRELRAAGFRTALEDSSLRDGLKYANRLGSRHVIAIDEREFSEGSVLIKDMQQSTQETVPQDRIVSYFNHDYTGGVRPEDAPGRST